MQKYNSLKKLLLSKFIELQSYFKMCLVGLSGVIVQFVTFNLLRPYVPMFKAVQAGVILALINNYILNTKFTFKKRPLNKYQRIKSFFQFVIYSILMSYIQSYWLQILINYIGHGMLKENLIMFTGVVFASFINYFTYSAFIWPKLKFKQPLNR